MIKVLANGEGRYELQTRTGRTVGWIDGLRIGFGGFESEEDAMQAVVTIWPAFEAALAREYAGWPKRDVPPHEVHLERRPGGEFIVDGKQSLAKLIRPSDPDEDFGFELFLPSYATEGAAISIARSVAMALGDTAPLVA